MIVALVLLVVVVLVQALVIARLLVDRNMHLIEQAVAAPPPIVADRLTNSELHTLAHEMQVRAQELAKGRRQED